MGREEAGDSKVKKIGVQAPFSHETGNIDSLLLHLRRYLVPFYGQEIWEQMDISLHT